MEKKKFPKLTKDQVVSLYENLGQRFGFRGSANLPMMRGFEELKEGKINTIAFGIFEMERVQETVFEIYPSAEPTNRFLVIKIDK